MGRIIALVLLLGGLSGFTWWTINQKGAIKDTYAENKHSMFAWQDVSQIDRIFMADRAGRQILLQRMDDDLHWTFKNQKTGQEYRANPSAIFMLLQTITRIRVREPINKAALDNSVKSLATRATKVELYDKSGKQLRVYYVGAMTSGATGNLVIMQDSDQPYVGYIPNFQGTIDTRYIVDEKVLRDKAFLRVEPKDIEFVQVAYQTPVQQKESFRITQKSLGKYEVTPVYESTTPRPAEHLNQANAETFFEDFDVIAAEKIIYDKMQRDTVITTTPFAIVTYKATYHNEPQVFRIYSLYNPTADRGDGDPGHRQKIQRYFVDINEDNFFLTQHMVMRSLFWGHDFFFQNAPIVLEEDEVSTKQSFPDGKDEIREARAKRKRLTTQN
ncbi:MAG: hypothetical protein ACRBFS_12825 [Aureispira sp.]